LWSAPASKLLGASPVLLLWLRWPVQSLVKYEAKEPAMAAMTVTM
jgi:hypothetical protein